MTKKKGRTATDSEVDYCRKVVDKQFKPMIEKYIDVLNKFLAKKNLRAGLEISWFFDSTEGEPDVNEDSRDN